jgi:maltose phosphorylase
MSIVEGFGGMRIVNDTLSFEPKIPEQWEGFSFKVNFRNQIIKVNACKGHTHFELEGHQDLEILVNGSKVIISPNKLMTV